MKRSNTYAPDAMWEKYIGWSPYHYSMNDPVNYRDWNGLYITWDPALSIEQRGAIEDYYQQTPYLGFIWGEMKDDDNEVIITLRGTKLAEKHAGELKNDKNVNFVHKIKSANAYNGKGTDVVLAFSQSFINVFNYSQHYPKEHLDYIGLAAHESNHVLNAFMGTMWSGFTPNGLPKEEIQAMRAENYVRVRDLNLKPIWKYLYNEKVYIIPDQGIPIKITDGRVTP